MALRRLGVLTALALMLGLLAPSTQASTQSHVITIWPLGDSITRGWTGPSTNVGGGYRGFLDAQLEAAAVGHRFVGTLTIDSVPSLDLRGQQHHDGHGGYTIADDDAGIDGRIPSHPRAPGNWLAGLSPDLVIIHLGTNDVANRSDPGVRYPTSDGRVDPVNPRQRAWFVAHMTARLDHLLKKIHRYRPGARFVLATIVPIGRDNCDHITPAFAKAVRGLVVQERLAGLRVELADVFAAFTAEGADGSCQVLPQLMSADGIHPTSLGYSVIGRVIASTVIKRQI